MIRDGRGLPLNVVLSPGQTHETQLFDEWWNTTEVTDLTWKHLIPPDALAGDKGYRSAKIVDPLTAENVAAVIPEQGKKANDVDHPDIDREAYRRRNVVERRIGLLKEFGRIFGRFEKTAVNYLAMIRTAFIRLFLSELIS